MKMTLSELVSQQALEIANLKSALYTSKEIVKDIYGSLYAIGAPLNDNKIGLNEEQLKYFTYSVGNKLGDLLHLLNKERL